MSALRPSSRLVRAVHAERAELARHRARLAEEAEELRSALARLEHGLAEIDDRRALLDRLAPAPPESSHPRAERGGANALRGPAIRETAVRMLAERGGEALHYREWFELVTRAGYEIAGKHPPSVFLSQLSRSPAVRKGTRAGVYELDRQAAARHHAELDALQRQLRELSASAGVDVETVRVRRARLTTEIGRTERALEEIERVLGPPRPSAASPVGDDA